MAEQKENPSFKLRYFGAPGRGQSIRLALIASGFAFTDEFVTGEEFGAAKKAGTSVTLPELVIFDAAGKEVNAFNQSLAILRYIGAVSGLYGDNALQRLQIDEIVATVPDVASEVYFKKPEERAQAAKDGKFVLLLKFLNRRVEENDKAGNKKGFAVGDKLSIADISLFSLCAALASGFMEGIPKDILSAYPRLQKIVEVVGAIDSIKAFGASFPQRLADYKDDAKKASVKAVTYPGKTCPDVAAK